MKKYDAYKPSCVEWIDEVPNHWTKIHIKHTTNGKGGLFVDGDWIESKDLSLEGIRYLTSGNVGVIKYKEQGEGYITEDKFQELKCTEVFPGDILISRLNEPIGRACIVPNLDSKIVVAVDNVICRVNDLLYDKRYLVYEMNCKAYSDYTNCLARGTGMHRISRGMLGQINIVIPPLSEQTTIADYLDAKCAKIDNVVAVQWKRIELLKELKQSIITKAVTKGLDKTAKMKDSGIEWIGEIPEMWRLKRGRFIVKLLPGFPADSNLFTDDDTFMPLIRIRDIENTTTEVFYKGDYPKEYLIQANDVLVGMDGEFNIAKWKGSDAILNQRVCKIIETDEMLENYAYYLFQTPLKLINDVTYSTTVKHLSTNDIKDFRFSVPPLSEQTAIADYLDKKCATIDKQILKVEKQIELLKEYKQSVITECVTGKRKVC